MISPPTEGDLLDMAENTSLEPENFVQRKKDHIQISLREESQALTDQFSPLVFQHNALPEINFEQVCLDTQVFGRPLKAPLFVSSMTLGHQEAETLNHRILRACEKRGWMMGVGSQRSQLFDPLAHRECEALRDQFPGVVIFGNLGLSQLIETPVEVVETLVSSLGATFMVIHSNPLQEVIQPEGTPQFKGGLKALETLCARLSVPVVLKETGCGFSPQNFEALKGMGLGAIDVSGRGGTHWGRVEGYRMEPHQMGFQVAQSFAHWGLSTVDSLKEGIKAQMDCELWASGGVRTGLEAAKLMALGAPKVGFAKPILEAALEGEERLLQRMECLEYELKVALFCLGLSRVETLVGKRSLLK